MNTKDVMLDKSIDIIAKMSYYIAKRIWSVIAMKVPSTEVQNNFGKYIKIASELEDVIITRKGKRIAKLVSYEERNIVAEQAVNYLFNKRRMTYEEFIEFTEKSDSRYELIDGDVYYLASPSYSHQVAVSEIYGSLFNWFKGKKCRPLTSPFDVTLEKAKDNICVVQPDIIVICDKDKINQKGRYSGVPTLVAEVLSDSTKRKDMIKKLDLFMQTGVKEYWMVDTEKKEVYAYSFEKRDGENDINDYISYKEDMILKSKAFAGLEIKLREVFAD